MFRCVMNVKAFGQTPCFTSLKRFIQRSEAMRIQIIHNQSNLAASGYRSSSICLICRAQSVWWAYGNNDMSFTSQWLNFHKYLCYTISYIFIIHSCRLTRLAKNRGANFTDQVLAGLIHADQRIVCVVWKMINLKNILHRRYKGCTSLRRDFPVFFEVRFTFIFFNILCTVICETAGARLSSTALSASNLTVHRRYPDGVFEHARAMSRASKAPSKITSRGGFTVVCEQGQPQNHLQQTVF